MKKVLSVATFLFVAIIASASFSHIGPDKGVYFITSGCVKCEICVEACPHGAIYDAGEQYQIDWVFVSMNVRSVLSGLNMHSKKVITESSTQ